jgi:MFS family permease
MTNRSKAGLALAVLFAINMMNFYDRNIAGAVAEPMRHEWGLSDTDIGLLGTAFTLLYAAMGVPLGRLADRVTRTRILAGGVFVWSLFTGISGLVTTPIVVLGRVVTPYVQMFGARLGVGIGEASCAPAGSSLIGDLFPASKRARALSIFMLGLPIGIAASNAVSGMIVQGFSFSILGLHIAMSPAWRRTFFVAAIPGLICAAAALALKEPARGGSEIHEIGGRQRPGPQIFLKLIERLSDRPHHGRIIRFLRKLLRRFLVAILPYLLVLSIPTIWWLILSGALHNFNMYAIGQFLIPFLRRFHGMSPKGSGLGSMAVYGLSGVPGLVIGGLIGDAITRHRKNGRLLVGAVALTISVPMLFLALGRPAGDTVGFMLLMGCGIGVMYVYYSTVYSAIQDVIEPSLRGTAMALYFFAMYVLGASFGPVATGLASDHYTRQAAIAAGASDLSQQALEPFRAAGLHSALYIVPILGALLALVLLAASTTVTNDMNKLHEWMREAAGVPAPAATPAEVGD